MKIFIARLVAKISKWLLSRLNRNGSALPGKLALKIAPDLITKLTKNYKIIAISGTNGKTTTTALICNILKQKNTRIITNASGANMIQGIATSLALQYKPKEKGICVFEVDEANVPILNSHVTIDLLVLTNLFEDQLDRFNSIHKPFELITHSLKPKTQIIANGDLPIFYNLSDTTLYYGFEQGNNQDIAELCPNCQKPLRYELTTFANLGKYQCTHCDLHRKPLAFTLSQYTLNDNQTIDFTINKLRYHLPNHTRYNLYNALAAISVGIYLNADINQIQNALNDFPQNPGRLETFTIHNIPCRFHLVKNYVGFNQALSLLNQEKNNSSLLILINNQAPDGYDTTWLNQVEFKQLIQINPKAVAYGGMVHELLKNQLEKQLKVPLTYVANPIEIIQFIQKQQQVELLCSYTALTTLRKYLVDNNYLLK